jgi:hypothetical protein
LCPTFQRGDLLADRGGRVAQALRRLRERRLARDRSQGDDVAQLETEPRLADADARLHQVERVNASAPAGRKHLTKSTRSTS